MNIEKVDPSHAEYNFGIGSCKELAYTNAFLIEIGYIGPFYIT